MFGIKSDSEKILEAIKRSHATVEFTLDGDIVAANENFLSLMGYDLAEVVGKHHSMFVDAVYAKSEDYRQFWVRLNRGESFTAAFARIAKDGKELWLQATYSPVFNARGEVYKVVKVATDVTDQLLKAADYKGQVAAIRRSNMVAEFDLKGTILYANDHFLNAMGYTLDEIVGHNHRIFIDTQYAQSGEYAKFWNTIRDGLYFSAEYQRVGKDGRKVLIQATYNPIFDMAGCPFKVVKYATDITTRRMRAADHAAHVRAIREFQAIASFDMNGVILDANDNFLRIVGYSLEQVKGKHHSMFVDAQYAQSQEYKDFWNNLRSGKHVVSNFRRFSKGGREVWINGNYSPIMEPNGKPFKVVKFATDITSQVHARTVLEDLAQNWTDSAGLVARSYEGLLASISKISDTMHRTQAIADEIVAKSDAANEARSALEQTSEAMEGVVGIIRKLADQVNLLALNATIEAARAGDAGKGFAVVAGEVKNLAIQTAKGADEIAEQIAALKSITQQVSTLIHTITESAGSVGWCVNAVAVTIKEQTALTSDISKNISVVFDGIRDLSEKLRKIE